MTEYLQPDISPVVNAIYEAIADWFPRQKADARGQLAFAIAHDVLARSSRRGRAVGRVPRSDVVMPAPDYDKAVSGVIEVGAPRPELHRALHKYSVRQLLAICFCVGLIMVITLPNHSVARVVGFWVMGIPIGIAFMWCCWRFSVVIWRALDPLFETVPSPQVIAIRLEEEWGRPPTVVEVAAVQQMLINEHNQRLINGGLVIGAIFLLGHHDH